MDKPNKAKIIVVFTDISGSSQWVRKVGDEAEALRSFMTAHEKETSFFKQRTKANFYKRLGDGRLFVYELEMGTESNTAANVLKEALGLVARVVHLIAMLRIGPNGFRIRVMTGHGIKESFEDGQTDWEGDVLNTCHEFLAHAPEIPLMVDDRTKQLISQDDAKTQKLIFELLGGRLGFWAVRQGPR